MLKLKIAEAVVILFLTYIVGSFATTSTGNKESNSDDHFCSIGNQSFTSLLDALNNVTDNEIVHIMRDGPKVLTS